MLHKMCSPENNFLQIICEEFISINNHKLLIGWNLRSKIKSFEKEKQIINPKRRRGVTTLTAKSYKGLRTQEQKP